MDSRVSTVDKAAQPVPLACPQIGPAERDAVDEVLRSPALGQGAQVAAFEAEFSKVVGGRPCVAVSSGTSALHLGLLAAGAGAGDEVIVPSFTAPATADAIVQTGATPVFADIERATLCVDPKSVEALVTPRTIGMVAVHLFGQVAEMADLEAVAEAHGLAIFEDACHALGAKLHGRAAGTFGTAAAFSFNPSMSLAAGEGGMVVCADEALAQRVRRSRDGRMSDVAAAMARVQLGRLPGFNRVRRMNAALLNDGLRGVEVPAVRTGATHVYSRYAVRSSARDEIADALAGVGIATAVPVPTPVHALPTYSVPSELPETAWASAELLSVPVHPGVEATEVLRIVRAINTAVGSL